ncbi:MAG: hypothetical protein AAFV51_01415 [Pseudomonadota bacterium]
MKIVHILCAASVAIAGACSSIPKSTKDALNKPVNCETAEEDLIELAAGLPTGRQRARAVVTSLVPAGLALGVITMDLRNRAKVVNGTLESDIYNKMADITAECGIEPAELESQAPST